MMSTEAKETEAAKEPKPKEAEAAAAEEEDLRIPDICSSVSFPLPTAEDEAPFPSVTDRYYTHLVTADGAQSVWLHSNRICLVGLAEKHPARERLKKVTKVNFKVSGRLNRLDNAVRGKSKRGGQVVDENAILAWIEGEDGAGESHRFPVRSLVRGRLIEVNEGLVADPAAAVRDSGGGADGYVAIVLPKDPDAVAEMKTRLVVKKEKVELGAPLDI